MSTLELNGSLDFSQIEFFLTENPKVTLAESSKKKLTEARNFVEAKLKEKKAYYGINTGFGKLANKRIYTEDLTKLQENIVLSHSAGVGEPFSRDTSRLIMLLRANVLAQGYSGICSGTLDLLLDFLNQDITPIIPSQGSVGASGDLAPLSHIALALIGKGEVVHQSERMPAAQALEMCKLQAVTLQAKEGLALVNGTQAITALASQTILQARNLMKSADIIGALSVEGDRASRAPFDERIHQLRSHPGQVATAANVLAMIQNSGIMEGHADCHRVQDPYSFRCIPQVHGASKDAFHYASNVISRELKSCTDNPLLFPNEDDILSGGNFHGQPLAIALDTLAIALAELGSISERRVAILIAPLDNELPTSFLVPNSGLNSGMMIPHVTMSALVSENKVLCHPASVDSIPTSGGQEDHVSMGLTAAWKASRVAQNVAKILSIELLAAVQAIDMQPGQEGPGKGTKAVYDLVRAKVPPIEEDRIFYQDIEKCLSLIEEKSVLKAAESVIGELQLSNTD